MRYHHVAAGIFMVSLLLVGPAHVRAQPESDGPQVTRCVEVAPEVTNNFTARRASSRTDCDPAVAFSNAQSQSRVNARDAIAATCRQRITQQEAEEICRNRGLSLPTTPGTDMKGRPLAAEGRPQPNFSLPIANNSPKLCAILRNIPNQTETTTQPAGVENGFCVFNNNETTTKTVRSRAFCGVQCFPGL